MTTEEDRLVAYQFEIAEKLVRRNLIPENWMDCPFYLSLIINIELPSDHAEA